jgi:hypothetical protein
MIVYWFNKKKNKESCIIIDDRFQKRLIGHKFVFLIVDYLIF